MNVIKAFFCIIICQMAGIIGSFFTIASIPTWYSKIKKPPFTPPDWIFGPVWIILYTLMGISLFLILKKGWHDPKVKNAILIFGVQLLLNASWSVLFFGMKSPLAGLIDICALWFLVLWTILTFFPMSNTAGLLLIPYFLWGSFAAILNFWIWKNNI